MRHPITDHRLLVSYRHLNNLLCAHLERKPSTTQDLKGSPDQPVIAAGVKVGRDAPHAGERPDTMAGRWHAARYSRRTWRTDAHCHSRSMLLVGGAESD
jgi:hypothetical protein